MRPQKWALGKGGMGKPAFVRTCSRARCPCMPLEHSLPPALCWAAAHLLSPQLPLAALGGGCWDSGRSCQQRRVGGPGSPSWWAAEPRRGGCPTCRYGPKLLPLPYGGCDQTASLEKRCSCQAWALCRALCQALEEKRRGRPAGPGEGCSLLEAQDAGSLPRRSCFLPRLALGVSGSKGLPAQSQFSWRPPWPVCWGLSHRDKTSLMQRL